MCAKHRSPFIVFGFETTHAALAAESVLKHASLQVVPVPTPRAIGGMCGIALRVPSEQAPDARDHLANAGLAPSAEIEIEDLIRA